MKLSILIVTAATATLGTSAAVAANGDAAVRHLEEVEDKEGPPFPKLLEGTAAFAAVTDSSEEDDKRFVTASAGLLRDATNLASGRGGDKTPGFLEDDCSGCYEPDPCAATYCAGGRCIPKLDEGALCGNYNDCKSNSCINSKGNECNGLYCGTCKKLASGGILGSAGSCCPWKHDQCAQGLYCKRVQHWCIPQNPRGQGAVSGSLRINLKTREPIHDAYKP